MGHKPKHRRAGRPPLPKGRAKSRVLLVRFTGEAMRAMKSVARAKRQSLSEWVRGTLSAALKS